MKTVDVLHLQHHLGRYLDEVEHGEILEVRRRRNVIARIITAVQRAASEHIFERDIVSARLRRKVPEWSDVFRIATKLSQDYTAETLARSLDIIHVAIAICERSDLFITADVRQESVARKAGMQTEMIE